MDTGDLPIPEDDEPRRPDVPAETGNARPDTVTELFLADRGLESASGLARYTQLECLYMHRNNLTRVRDLDCCFRVRHLYLHNNSIVSPRGLARLQFLEVLLLHDNMLRSLSGVLHELGGLKVLKTLTLFGNAVEQEPGYRVRVIHALPTLETFDRHQITRTERVRAQRTVDRGSVAKQKSKKTVAFGTSVPSPPPPSKPLRRAEDDLWDTVREYERNASKREAEDLAALIGEQPLEVNQPPPNAEPPLPSGLDFLGRSARGRSSTPVVDIDFGVKEKKQKHPFFYKTTTLKPPSSDSDSEDDAVRAARSPLPKSKIRLDSRAFSDFNKQKKRRKHALLRTQAVSMDDGDATVRAESRSGRESAMLAAQVKKLDVGGSRRARLPPTSDSED